MNILHTVSDFLPGIAGLFLAALGVAGLPMSRELRWFETHPKTRWTIAIFLILVGIGATAADFVQKRDDKIERGQLTHSIAVLQDELNGVKNKLNENQRVSVGLVYIGLAVQGQEMKPYEKIPFAVAHGVKGNTAKDMRAHLEVFSVKGSATRQLNREEHSTFLTRAIKRLDERGEDKLDGTIDFVTLELTLSKNEIAEILSNNRTVYVMGRAEWKNLNGSDDHWDLCMWMQPPKMKYLIQRDLPFHYCSL
jgi:hypothetical protein